MFLGTHTPLLDDKGRLILPARFRDELAGGVVITKGQERCLYVFTTNEFNRIAAQLQHPHILPMHDSGEANGFLYYVMPYVEGESLRARLRREGELPVPDAARLLGQIADAVNEYCPGGPMTFTVAVSLFSA